MSKPSHEKGQQLWQAIQLGDQTAFDQFYLLYVKLLYNYGCQLTTDIGLVEDCIQELFIQLWQKRMTLTFQSSIKNYLLLSLRRLIARKNQGILELTLDNQPEKILKSEEIDLVAIQIKRKQQVQQAIEGLPKRQKEAIFLKYYENLDYDEIAKIMTLQKNGVYKLVSVGISRIRKLLKQ